MTVAFYADADCRFEAAISAAFATGCRRIGVACHIVPGLPWDGRCLADVAVVVGVKKNLKRIFDGYLTVGRHAVVIDKGYVRVLDGPLDNRYWRMAVDAFQPLAYLDAVERPGDRWRTTDVKIARQPRFGDNVVFAGSSQKFCNWHGLGDATAYATRVLADVRAVTSRPLVYRPKPSWRQRRPIAGSRYSVPPVKLAAELKSAHCVVTYGSNACFEACLAGVPAVVLGDGVAQFSGLASVANVPTATWPGADAVTRLAWQLAYCQWTLAELEAGLAARELVRLIESGAPGS